MTTANLILDSDKSQHAKAKYCMPNPELNILRRNLDHRINPAIYSKM